MIVFSETSFLATPGPRWSLPGRQLLGVGLTLWVLLAGFGLRADAIPTLQKTATSSFRHYTQQTAEPWQPAPQVNLGGQQFSVGQRVCIALGPQLAFTVTLDADTLVLLTAATVGKTGELEIGGAGRTALLHHLYGKIMNNQSLAEAAGLQEDHGQILLVEHFWRPRPSALIRMPVASNASPWEQASLPGP